MHTCRYELNQWDRLEGIAVGVRGIDWEGMDLR